MDCMMDYYGLKYGLLWTEISQIIDIMDWSWTNLWTTMDYMMDWSWTKVWTTMDYVMDYYGLYDGLVMD